MGQIAARCAANFAQKSGAAEKKFESVDVLERVDSIHVPAVTEVAFAKVSVTVIVAATVAEGAMDLLTAPFDLGLALSMLCYIREIEAAASEPKNIVEAAQSLGVASLPP